MPTTHDMPETLLLGARLYAVQQIAPSAAPPDNPSTSAIDTDAETLTVQDNLSDRVAADCILHEATHHWLIEVGVELGSAAEEVVCDAVARGMLLLVRDNPEWMSWFAQAARSLRHPAAADEG